MGKRGGLVPPSPFAAQGNNKCRRPTAVPADVQHDASGAVRRMDGGGGAEQRPHGDQDGGRPTAAATGIGHPDRPAQRAGLDEPLEILTARAGPP